MTYPLSYQLFNRSPLPPVVLCIVLMVILGGGYTISAFQSGLIDSILAGKVPSAVFRATFTAMLITAYIPMAQYYLIKWSEENWQLLSTHVQTLPPLNVSLSVFWGVLGMLIQYSFFFGLPWYNGKAFDPSYWSLTLVVTQVVVSGAGWTLYRLLASMIKYANQFSRIARALPTVDLFDTKFNKVFVQQGVKSALLVIGFISISGIIIVAPGDGFRMAILVGVISCLSATFAMIIPALGIQKRTAIEKKKHLKDIRKKLQKLTYKIALDDLDHLKLSTLLALETRIQAVKEWPFDASSISKFAFYISIGLGSWIGAALVEKLLDKVI